MITLYEIRHLRYCSVLLLFFLSEAFSSSDAISRRDDTIPFLDVEGTNYEVGFNMGAKFKSIILEFLASSEWVVELDEQRSTPVGKDAYVRTLDNMTKRFPWLIEEIQGISDGSGIPFETLFLLQMDDIMSTVNDNHDFATAPIGCTDIGIKQGLNRTAVMGHTEDTVGDMLNRVYIVKAHVIPSEEMQAKGAREERFASITYPGHLPGYTMGFNIHGLFHSINTLSPQTLIPGRTPRTFLARTLLGAQTIDETIDILKDEGLGIANGFNVNIMSTSPSEAEKGIIQLEVAPNTKNNEDNSLVYVHEDADEERIWHVNNYKYLKVKERDGDMIRSSEARKATLLSHPEPKNYSDVALVLSDQSGKIFKIFQEEGPFLTALVGIFDFENKVWNLYTKAPDSNEPALKISFDLA